MLRGMRWLLISKILASCRPSSHTDLPLFSRYFTCIDMVNILIALAVSAACARLFVWGWCPCWRCQSTCLRCLSASVVHVLFFLLLAALFLQVLLLTSTLSSREIWGMNSPDLPELPVLGSPSFMITFFVLRRGDWRTCDGYPRRGMSFVVLLTTPLSRLSVRPPCMALLVAFEGLASRALWHLAMIASIASITIGDGINCIHRNWSIAACCCLSQLA